MQFTKMQGCGNNYIYIDCFKEKVQNPSELSVKVSNVNFGIGSDGLILIKPSNIADFKMEMYNADGSEGKMCGNGIRCVAKYVYDLGLTDKTVIDIETLSGVKTLTLKTKSGKVESVRVNMGKAITNAADIPALYGEKNIIVNEPLTINGIEYRITCVSMGNPHCIIFSDNVAELDLASIGPGFERHSMFPEGVNTEFIHILDRNNIEMRVWERGSGETFACGTGACASVAACVLNGFTDRNVTVHLRGGDLNIIYMEDGTVIMEGPAEFICSGELSDMED